MQAKHSTRACSSESPEQLKLSFAAASGIDVAQLAGEIKENVVKAFPSPAYIKNKT